MGIGKDSLYALMFAAERGVDFKQTAMIGRQGCDKYETMRNILKKYDPLYQTTWDEEFKRTNDCPQPYAETLFKYFGAETVDSVDYSDYEGASILQDMNKPIGDHLKNKYTLVYDGGALEHVFNYPVAIKNCMEMVATGGHLVLATPANNWFGHGFYQFSPELFFSLLDEHNGFSDTQILMQDDYKAWYQVNSPKTLKKRVEFCCACNSHAMMYVTSKKTGAVPDTITAFQSDYVDLWETSPAGSVSGNTSDKRPFVDFVERITPQFLQPAAKQLYRRLIFQRRLREYYKPVCSPLLLRRGAKGNPPVGLQ
jgi:hypothetical protein